MSMYSFIRILTAAAIFVHSIVGCCAHEGHSTDSQVCGHALTSASCDHEHHLPITHQADTPQDDCPLGHNSNDETPQDCHHGTCEWPAPEARQSDELLVAGFDLGLCCYFDTSVDRLISVGCDSCSCPAFIASLHPLPVRAHLAYCVILI